MSSIKEDQENALKFLKMVKLNWKEKIKGKNYKISCAPVTFKNPLSGKEEEKISMCLEADLDKPAELVEKCLSDFNIRKEFDSLFEQGKLISEENPDANTRITKNYLYLKMGFVFSDRDFLLKRTVWKDFEGKKNTFLIHSVSFEDPNYPAKDKPVRGVYYNRVCSITPIDEKTCHLTLCNCMDMMMPDIGTIMTEKHGASGTDTFIKKLIEKLNKM